MTPGDIDRARRIDIVMVIGRDVELKPAGKPGRTVGVCPFCAARPDWLPNLSGLAVHSRLGLYHCFSCRVGGDVIDYMMRTQGMTAEAACSWLEVVQAEAGDESAKVTIEGCAL